MEPPPGERDEEYPVIRCAAEPRLERRIRSGQAKQNRNIEARVLRDVKRCVFPEGVAAEKRLPHAVEAPLAELTHGARISDSVSILLCGTLPLPAGVFASARPVAMSTIFGTWANALDSPAALVLDAPIWVASAMNCCRAHTEATVVTSSMTI